jgi:hypothetical protein
MKPLYFYLFTVLVVSSALLGAGCAASSSDGVSEDLELETLTEYQARLDREAAEKALEGEKKLSGWEEELDDFKNKEVVSRPLSELMGSEVIDPEELGALQVPGTFRRVNPMAPEALEIYRRANEMLPGVSVVLVAQDSKVMFLAGKVPMLKSRVEGMERSQFVKEMKRMGAQYEAFYENAYGAKTKQEIIELDPVLGLKVKSGYSYVGESRRDVRFVYFYQPDYRLNLMLSGEEDAYEMVDSQFLSFIATFGSYLGGVFPEGLNFKE